MGGVGRELKKKKQCHPKTKIHLIEVKNNNNNNNKIIFFFKKKKCEQRQLSF
jgi:hypothetical protein